MFCGSRHLRAAEKNLNTLEGEALAVTWCLKKAHLFLLSCRNLTFITDHRALTKIFGDKELKGINNPRILNLKERTMVYNFCIKYLKGKTYCAADALSRYPILASAPEESDEADNEAVCAAMVAAAAETTEDDEWRRKLSRMRTTSYFTNAWQATAGRSEGLGTGRPTTLLQDATPSVMPRRHSPVHQRREVPTLSHPSHP